MLLLLFEIGKGHYALDINQIIEIVPLVKLKKIPTSPVYVSGLMNYRGEGIPVVDLCQLVDNIDCEDALSTRIIIVNYPLHISGNRALGLIANNATETIRTTLSKPSPTGVIMDKSLCDNYADQDSTEMIQWFDIKKMLPEKEIYLLFEEEE
jgi:chemotaxis-related protein WspB